MIASLHGTIESLGIEWAIVNVGGVGFQVYVPTSTLSTMGAAGAEVKLFTHLHLREDNAALYGFATPEELGLFQTLIGVSGSIPNILIVLLEGGIRRDCLPTPSHLFSVTLSPFSPSPCQGEGELVL